MATRFDAFARVLADNVSRRSALRRLGAGLSALLLGVAASSCETDSGGPTASTRVLGPTFSTQKTSCKCKDPSQVCFQGACTCPPGKQLCRGSGACVDYCGNSQVLDVNCTCVSYCAADETFCGGACVSTACSPSQTFSTVTCRCEDNCPAGQTVCSGVCRDLSTDVNNCGACGTICSVANGTAACVQGVCTVATCNAGFGDCDGVAANGCETDLQNDVNNCGACGHICSAPNAVMSCVNGACQIIACSPGFFDCDGDPSTGCEGTAHNANNSCGPPCAAPVNCPPGTNCVNQVCV